MDRTLEGDTPFQAAHLPSLQRLISSDVMACLLVPDRPITDIFINFSERLWRPESRTVFQKLEEGTSTIRVFGFRASVPVDPTADLPFLLGRVATTPALINIEELSLIIDISASGRAEEIIATFLEAVRGLLY